MNADREVGFSLDLGKSLPLISTDFPIISIAVIEIPACYRSETCSRYLRIDAVIVLLEVPESDRIAAILKKTTLLHPDFSK